MTVLQQNPSSGLEGFVDHFFDMLRLALSQRDAHHISDAHFFGQSVEISFGIFSRGKQNQQGLSASGVQKHFL